PGYCRLSRAHDRDSVAHLHAAGENGADRAAHIAARRAAQPAGTAADRRRPGHRLPITFPSILHAGRATTVMRAWLCPISAAARFAANPAAASFATIALSS